jgi:hypothetical protein
MSHAQGSGQNQSRFSWTAKRVKLVCYKVKSHQILDFLLGSICVIKSLPLKADGTHLKGHSNFFHQKTSPSPNGHTQKRFRIFPIIRRVICIRN